MYPYEVIAGSLLNVSWQSTTNSQCDVYRTVDYGYEQYVTTLYSSGGQFYQFSDFINSGWSTVSYYIKEGYYDYDIRTVGPINVITANSPPTTPGSITSPTSTNGGGILNLSWTASTDPEWDSLYYILQRSVNSGTYIYEGTSNSNSYNAPIDNSWSTVRYRVQASDVNGNTSGYSYSTTINVITNSPPTKPSYITTSNEILYGEPVNVSLGSSTDPNGDSITYSLEVSYNDEPYKVLPTVVTNINIPSWCTKVIVRARAADSKGAYSDYITATPTFVVESKIHAKVGTEVKRYKEGWLKAGTDKFIKEIWVKVANAVKRVLYSPSFKNGGTATSLSTARFYPATASINGFGLFAGGSNSYTTLTTYSTVDAYNTSLTRTLPTTLSQARTNPAGTANLKYAIFAGGLPNYTAFVSSVVDAYTHTLTRLIAPSLSIARNAPSAVTLGNYMLVGGGTSKSIAYNRVDVYNENLVRTSATTLYQTAHYVGSATVGNYALFAGGINDPNSSGSGTYYNNVTTYNSSLVRGSATALSVSRSLTTFASSVQDYAIFAGGATSTTTNSNRVEAYNRSLVKTTATALSSARSGGTGSRIGPYAIFAGGGNNGTQYNSVDMYNNNLTRSQPTGLSIARHNLGGVDVGKYVLFGGGFTTTPYSTVDVYKYD